MATRVEFERPMFVSGEPGLLYVSSGPSDDYLEISLPVGVDPGPSVLRGLRDLSGTGDDLAVEFHDGSRTLVSITALYIDDVSRKSRPAAERVADILSNLVRVAPILDFGDLLPERSQVVEGLVAVAPVDGKVDTAERLTVGSSARTGGDASPRPAWPEQMRRARDFVARGQLHKALRVLDDLLRDSPDLFEAEDLAAAVRLLDRREKAARREPRSPKAHLEVGFSYLQVGRNRDAANMLRRATLLEARLYLAHLLLGIALHRLGDLLLARDAYRRAAQLRPGESVPGDLLAALERGEPPFALAESGSRQPKIPNRASNQQLAWAG